MTTISKKDSSKKKVVKKVPAKKTTRLKNPKVNVPTPTNTNENIYKVPVKLWKSFGETGQKAYNGVMQQSEMKIEFIAHPKMPPMAMEHWATLRHNFACFAAWAVKPKK
jgi:hypothetical protein